MTSIMAFPKSGFPYQDCFYRAVSELGVSVKNGMCAGRWLMGNLHGVDYIHIHWPEFLYRGPTTATTLRRCLVFFFLLFLSRWRGAKILWTIHNLLPHDRSKVPGLDRFARWLVARVSVRCFVHGPAAAREVWRVLPWLRQRTVIIDHGHWVGYYLDTMNRQQARSVLKLRNEHTAFLMIGGCKPYKNPEALIATMERLPPETVLMIVGMFSDPSYEAKIRRLVESSPAEILIRAGYVPDEDLQIYLRACDVVVVPYREILTSGTAMLALSFGRPVVAPALGFLKDAIGDGCGVLYDPADRNGLEQAMRQAMATTFEETRIVRAALSHPWTASAKRFVESLDAAVRPPTPARPVRSLPVS